MDSSEEDLNKVGTGRQKSKRSQKDSSKANLNKLKRVNDY